MSNIVLKLLDSPSLDDLRHEWQQAFAQWLVVSATHTTTQRAYRTAWNDLWSFIHNLDPSGDPPQVWEF